MGFPEGIKLKNGHRIDYIAAPGSLGYDGRGWFIQNILVSMGIIKPDLFTVFSPSISAERIMGRFNPMMPWRCVKNLKDGYVYDTDFANPGYSDWNSRYGTKLDANRIKMVLSIFGRSNELRYMAKASNDLDIVGIEANLAWSQKKFQMTTEEKISAVKMMSKVTRQPILIRDSAMGDYLTVAKELQGIAEGVSLDDIPWEKHRIKKPQFSPLYRNKVRGSGYVSGKNARRINWNALINLKLVVPEMPTIGSSIHNRPDLEEMKRIGVRALSFGYHHFKPWKPTRIVLNEFRNISELFPI